MKSKLLWISLVIILISSSAYGLLYIGDFNQGIFQNTFFNGSVLKLNAGNLSGYYTSPIFDAGNISNWTSISWNVTEMGELPNYRQGNLMNGNVLLYHLNEPSGNITDYSGSNNTGTCFNSTCPYSISNGKLNQAYAFDGIDDYFLENATYGSNYTLSVWVKPFDLVNIENFGRTIIASSPSGTSGYGFWFLINGNRFRVYSYAVNSNSYTLSNFSNISANNWYNLVVSASKNGDSKIYVNGIFDKSFISGNQTFYNYLTIGDLRPNRKISFNGTIDELSIWNRTLSSQEIKEIYQRGIERLNLSIRACNSNNCNDSNWTAIQGRTHHGLHGTGRGPR